MDTRRRVTETDAVIVVEDAAAAALGETVARYQAVLAAAEESVQRAQATLATAQELLRRARDLQNRLRKQQSSRAQAA
jgi:cellobiose-specific phosphotransferase system component IIA